MKKLYKFYYDYSDTCEFLSGLFIEEEEIIAQAVGKTLYFDLGNADEETCKFKLDWSYIQEVKLEASTLMDMEKACGLNVCGHNPMDYIID